MKEIKEKVLDEIKKTKFLNDDELNNLNFYEAALYLESLNKIDEFLDNGDLYD